MAEMSAVLESGRAFFQPQIGLVRRNGALQCMVGEFFPQIVVRDPPEFLRSKLASRMTDVKLLNRMGFVELPQGWPWARSETSGISHSSWPRSHGNFALSQ